MARRELVTIVCDVGHDDGRERVAEETVRFSVGTRRYVLDLCAEHAQEFHDDLAGWISPARPDR